ncbi:transposase [Geotalea toluenoxydans]|uniref:transposase n=1 Tax=Geotalea toluenoxydans TaxID=421624 RepID=UPI0006D250F6|nr:transposase [Geotalea toluenoxydans]
MDIFSDDDSRLAYLQFLAEEARRFGVQFLSWCLMTNHVHFIAIPSDTFSLAKLLVRPIDGTLGCVTSKKGFAVTCSKAGSDPAGLMTSIS